MQFKKLADNMGMVYVPECSPVSRKNPCPDCFSCQWCGNERCRLCYYERAGSKEEKQKLLPDSGSK